MAKHAHNEALTKSFVFLFCLYIKTLLVLKEKGNIKLSATTEVVLLLGGIIYETYLVRMYLYNFSSALFLKISMVLFPFLI